LNILVSKGSDLMPFEIITICLPIPWSNPSSY
jgi:hypothetical protein